MLYSERIKLAMNLAYNAHSNQLDAGGYPYIFHAIHVAEQMNTENEVILALLHDVIEDTDITISNITYFGFNQTIINSLAAITRKQDETYFDYIHRVSKNKLATKVKIKDLEHNLDDNRLGRKMSESLRNRYTKALNILKDSLE